MLFSRTPLLMTICSTLLFASSTVAQTTTQDYQVRCLRFPPLVAGNQTFNPDAINALSQAISDNSLNPALPSDGIKLSPASASRVGWAGSGGYQVCLQNNWFFKTVMVPLKDLSEAISAVANTCCVDQANETPFTPGSSGRAGRCQDARAVVRGVDGSEIRVVGQDYGDLCCGMWGC